MNRGAAQRRPWTVGLLVAGLLSLAGCSPVYVMRAGFEEAKILWRRQPIPSVLQQPALAPDTRAKLELVLSVREFAAQIGLRVGGSYGSFATIDSNQVVYVVSAAPKLRLEPHTWWFPIVGSVPYKGFFDEGAARRQAEELQQEGLDTIVFPSIAFSTLGWFDDPLLSNLLRYDPVVLAGVVIHELLHNTFYAPGEVAFNESFANFVGYRGAAEYFAQRDGGDAATARRALEIWRDAETMSRFLGDLVDRLRAAYDAGISVDEREVLFDEAQARFAAISFQTDEHVDFAQLRLNNAVILHLLAYHEHLPLFDRMYEACGADLRRAVTRIIEAARGSDDPFESLRQAVDEGCGDAGAGGTAPLTPRAARGGAVPGAWG